MAIAHDYVKEDIGEDLTEVKEHETSIGVGSSEVHMTASLLFPDVAQVDIRKFRDYIFKTGATHGKTVIFTGLGYDISHSELLTKIYKEQGEAKFLSKNFTHGKKDIHGQRIDIVIDLPGIGGHAGKTKHIISGWMINEDGKTIRLNTPFSGFKDEGDDK